MLHSRLLPAPLSLIANCLLVLITVLMEMVIVWILYNYLKDYIFIVLWHEVFAQERLYNF